MVDFIKMIWEKTEKSRTGISVTHIDKNKPSSLFAKMINLASFFS